MRLVADIHDYERYLSEVLNSDKVATPSSFEEDVFERFFGDRQTNAPVLPWPKTHNLFKLRPSETTVWAGINGHGKTMATCQMALSLVQQGHPTCIASFEMPPESTLARIIRMASGGGAPTKQYIRKFLRWADGKLWIFDHEGTCQKDHLIAIAKYCAHERGIQHFIIDNLTKIATEDDYSGQQKFVDSVTSIGRDTGMHMHLVVHVRKGTSEYDLPDKFDVKGSGAIVDQVDNAFIVWRNKRKEERLAQKLAKDEEEKVKQQPDSVFVLNKQRHGEWEGKFQFWFDKGSQTFSDHPNAKVPHFEINIDVEDPEEKAEEKVLTPRDKAVFDW